MATKRKFSLDTVMSDAKDTISCATTKGTSESDQKVDSTRENNAKNMKKNIRNAFVSDESLFRLNLVKKEMNQKEGADHISLATLMGKIIEEYLDAKFPETKDIYRKIYGE